MQKYDSIMTAFYQKKTFAMPTLTIRQLGEDVYQSLKSRAHAGGRSMEAEVREILASTVRRDSWWSKWIASTKSLRGEKLPCPPRSHPRKTKRK